METPKSLSERLKTIRLQSNLYKEKLKNESENKNLEEYPKLRKPKPATLLKIQARQKKADNNSQIKPTTNMEEVQVPLRQEFLNKKEQLALATTNLLKKYEQRKNSTNVLDDMLSFDPEEAQPLTLHKNIDLHFDTELELKCINSPKFNKVEPKPLNFIEQHLVGILYTKVNAHPNGFFAENLPAWYKKTFDKEISKEWFELIKRSKEFYIENVQNKILLYAKERKEDPIIGIDLKASGDKETDETQKTVGKKSKERVTESSVGFVRYKHLQKSLKEYTQQSAGRDQKSVIKPSDRLNKAAISKKFSLVKK